MYEIVKAVSLIVRMLEQDRYENSIGRKEEDICIACNVEKKYLMAVDFVLDVEKKL